ncbi:unnamed protein product [Lactuca virosa]|uniref:DUF4005 domain-containing protein n=1 Tax=Lactuca virosa TaxID=75947 RepID=A0AAU9M1Y9_9ASTR|nr:unnamed protein product [Lactuca virosa]
MIGKKHFQSNNRADMAHSNEQTKLKPQLLKSSSFAWDRAFFTSDGVLDEDELSSIIKADGNNVKHQLQPLQEIKNLEAELFQEMEEASTKKFNKIKTKPTTSRHNSPLSNVKSSTTITRNSTRSKTGKAKADSPSKSHLPSHISSRTSSPGSPNSPGSPGSSSSTFALNQRSSRGNTSAPRRSSSTNARRKDEQKPGLSSSTSSTSLASSSLSSTYKVNQRSISTGRGTTLQHRSSNRDSSASSSLKTRPTSQTPDRTIKQSTTLYPRTKTTLFEDHGKERKIQAKKTGERSSSPGPSRVQTSGKERERVSSSVSLKGVRNIFVVSPEIMDIKGKLNALKMEINMQKREKCKETKMVPVKIGKSESTSSGIFKNSSSKMNNQARRT